MHCHSYALETGKYLLRLEKKNLHTVYSFYWLYTFYVQVIYTLCTVFLLLFTFYVYVVFTFMYDFESYNTALQC